MANGVLLQAKSGKEGEGRGISFAQLQRLWAPHSLMAADANPALLPKLGPAYWSTRPLPPEALALAVKEVVALAPTIYTALAK